MDEKQESQQPGRWEDENGAELECSWFPRDGEPVRRKIPAWVFDQLRKQRSSEPFIPFRVVGVRGREFGCEFPDYPKLATVWIDLGAWANKAQEAADG